MNYQETLAWMYVQLPMYQREGQAAYKANLDNALKLDEHFNHPHLCFKTIHVAGTNGKGSTSHMLASILQEAGYKTGLYTSPHLKDFRERIRVNGEMVSETYVTDFIQENRDKFDELKPSFFEMTVAMAFQYFKEMRVDIAVIETGLGGRLDSTNIITPVLSVITNISYDHCSLLGNTLETIAGEKAGIIKPGIPVVVGQRDKAYEDVFQQKAAECHAPLIFAGDVWKIERNREGNYDMEHADGRRLPDIVSELKGIYQMKNIPGVVESTDILKKSGFNIPERAMRKGIERVVTNTGLQGRWQVLAGEPYTVCDTGHNEDGIKEVLKQIKAHPFERLHMVIGMVNDKDITTVLQMLPNNALYYFCKASIPRALDEKVLAEKAHLLGLKGNAYPSVSAAYRAAQNNAEKKDMIYVGGSTFVVAEIL